jgi:transcription-repair coupling factor (superfamily II helicase)
VGRSDRRAYAYLLIPPEQTLSPVARKRLAAIREFSDLGSGFRIAALDLEIRGAGNLLGGEQSGHIEAVGFDMYVKLLEDTIRELKGEDLEDERRAAVNLRLDLRIDESYIPDMNQRLSAYRRLANARTLDEVDGMMSELRDRYGVPPGSVENLAEYARIRLIADRIGLETVDREGQTVVLRFHQDAKMDPVMVLRLVQGRGDLTLLPPAVLRLNLDASPERVAGASTGVTRPDGVRLVRSRPAEPARPESHAVRQAGLESSWWTARAAAGVSPGFTREEILAKDAFDPATPGGLFERLRDVLGQLSQSLVAS